MADFQINGRKIGAGQPCYIIAEMSANHHQDLNRAFAIIDAAADAGADALKLQTYTPDTITFDSRREEFVVKGGTLWDGRTLYDLYREAMTPWDWHPQLMERAASRGMDCFSSPFDESAVDFLEQLNVPAYKIASFEIGHKPLLQKIARTGKPVILSTGIAELADIEFALDVLRAEGASAISLLKCTSAYPADAADAQLHAIPLFAKTYDVVPGLSDHSMGTTVPVAAVALGACIVEKHLTLSRDDVGPDSGFSLEPAEFAELVAVVRETQAAVGFGSYVLTEKQIEARTFARSIFVVADMVAGASFSADTVRVIRPGHGLAPRDYEMVLGSKARVGIKAGTPLSWDLVDKE